MAKMLNICKSSFSGLIVTVLLWTQVGCASQPWEISQFPKQELSLSIAPVANLSFRTKAEIMAMRRAAVEREPSLRGLVDPHYDPEKSPVWEKIQDDLPWEGAEGLADKLPSQYETAFSDGDSLASTVLLNPFLLAHFSTLAQAFGQEPGTLTFFQAWIADYSPRELTFNGPARTLRVRYRWSAYWPNWSNKSSLLNLCNARDLGLRAYAVLSNGTAGVSVPKLDKIVENQVDYHPRKVRDEKDKFTDTLSNAVGNWEEDTAQLEVEQLPCKITIGFWKEVAGADLATPLLTEVIDVSDKDGRKILGSEEEKRGKK